MSKLFESPADEIARLIFVRHGRTNKNTESRIGARDDSDLDETGLRQAQLAARRLTDFPIRQISRQPHQARSAYCRDHRVRIGIARGGRARTSRNMISESSAA